MLRLFLYFQDRDAFSGKQTGTIVMSAVTAERNPTRRTVKLILVMFAIKLKENLAHRILVLVFRPEIETKTYSRDVHRFFTKAEHA